MINKQTLKVDEMYNEDIVKILPSSCSYVDDEYFKKEAGEDITNPNFKNHPVKVRAISIDWIIDTKGEDSHGLAFLEALLNSETLEIFDSDTIIAIIEFLYSNYKNEILKYRLPPYMLQLFTYYTAILLNE